jgi:CheY-like chemotaxis protein
MSRVNGRAAALTELITCLILNALDAMPEGGVLAIVTRDETDGNVAITVSDTGVGMPEPVQRRIFEPFFSTKGEGGSGLGLSMAYSIVKSHGGEIRVASEPGRGSVFTLTFPPATEAPESAAPAPVPESRRPARVLVIEDELQVRHTLAELLEQLGHTVAQAASGQEALALHATDRFDVILANIGMAGMNGWEVVERIRTTDRAVPILFTTGWGLRDEEHGRMTALGVRGCLFKPIRPDELDAAIQLACRPA